MSELTMQEQIEAVGRALRTIASAFIAQMLPAMRAFGLVTHQTYAWYVAGGLTRCYL